MTTRRSFSFKVLVKKALERTPYRVVRHSTLEKLRSKPADVAVSLVVASYNVEPYIERFLASVLGQTVLPERLEVILVNDGSTDRTGEIIDKWQARYPDYIRVVHQPNGGVCAARNTGLSLATGTWVGFPDPDDFLDLDYFKHMLAEIRHGHAKPLLAVVSNLIFFLEDRDAFSDSHPLRYRFAKDVTRLPSNDLQKFMHLSGATAWLHRPTLAKNGLAFDPRVSPSAEDMHLFNHLLIAAPDRTVSFLKNPVYYYRKRTDGSSLLDKTKTHPGWFSNQIQHGYIDLLRRSAETYGKVPHYIQRTCLYSIFWRFRYLVDQPHRAAFLSQEQRSTFLELLDEAFSYIEPETIASFDLAGCVEEHKVALLALYKGQRRDTTAVYVQQVDTDAGLVQFSYHTGGEDDFEPRMIVNGTDMDPHWRSRRTTKFMERIYFRQHFFWLPVQDGDDVTFERDGIPCIIKRGGKVLGETVAWLTLRNAVVPASPSASDDEARRLRAHVLARRDAYRGCWVLMDREDKADDNAEHLYRHLMATGRAAKAWFILSPSSPDWPRLEAEGFKLLPFRSDEHIAAQMNADFLLTSHADDFILWPVDRRNFVDLVRYRFVFLQHGVITTDMSHWFNTKPIRTFVTTMPSEYHDIVRSDGNYIFSTREVLHSGLARHDALNSRGQVEKGDSILIMPTWRKYLTDETNRTGMRRGKVDHFLESDYARNWLSFLKSPRLKAVARSHDLRIVFAPHPNIAQYLPDMDLPDHIEVVNMLDGSSYQDLFVKAKIAVTCFSSAAAEVAFLQRPVVYFQFDGDRIFAGDHVYQRGHFSFEEDGFGPVAYTADEALNAVERTLAGGEDPIYSMRREQAFPFRDGQCCERIYQAIVELDARYGSVAPATPERQPIEEAELDHSISAGVSAIIEAWDKGAREQVEELVTEILECGCDVYELLEVPLGGGEVNDMLARRYLKQKRYEDAAIQFNLAEREGFELSDPLHRRLADAGCALRSPEVSYRLNEAEGEKLSSELIMRGRRNTGGLIRRRILDVQGATIRSVIEKRILSVTSKSREFEYMDAMRISERAQILRLPDILGQFKFTRVLGLIMADVQELGGYHIAAPYRHIDNSVYRNVGFAIAEFNFLVAVDKVKIPEKQWFGSPRYWKLEKTKTMLEEAGVEKGVTEQLFGELSQKAEGIGSRLAGKDSYDASCIVHGDVNPGNFFVFKERSSVCIIDFEGILRAAPGVDVGSTVAAIGYRHLADVRKRGKILHQHLQDLINFYDLIFSGYSDAITHHGIDVDQKCAYHTGKLALFSRFIKTAGVAESVEELRKQPLFSLLKQSNFLQDFFTAGSLERTENHGSMR